MGCGSIRTHGETCIKIRDWLLEHDSDEDIRKEGVLGPPVNLDPYFATADKVCDVIWYHSCMEVLEVMSNKNRVSTILKLGLGLMDQLRSQRNRDDTILSISGFYFPAKDETGYVEQVMCEWEDKKMSFSLTVTQLEQGAIIDVANQERAKIDRIKRLHNHRFILNNNNNFLIIFNYSKIENYGLQPLEQWQQSIETRC